MGLWEEYLLIFLEFRRIGPLQEWWYLEDEEEVQTFLTSKRARSDIDRKKK